MNTGLQDAHNIAWKIAMVVKGKAPNSLLATYESGMSDTSFIKYLEAMYTLCLHSTYIIYTSIILLLINVLL